MPYEPERLPETATQIAGPIAWEAYELSLPRRLWGTLRSAFAPLSTIHAVSTGSIAAALRFSLVSALPWMPLWAVMPFTHTLLFKNNFALEVVQKGGLSVPWDVARALAIGFVLSAVGLVSWALPFVSLLRAYGKTPEPEIDVGHAAWRMVLYRAWVVPCGLTLLSLVAWSMPPEPSPWLVEISLLAFRLLPRMLILMHCFAMARYFGVAGLSSAVVAVVPLIVEMVVGPLAVRGSEVFLPQLPEVK